MYVYTYKIEKRAVTIFEKSLFIDARDPRESKIKFVNHMTDKR